MPLGNNADKVWEGWLIDGLGGQEEKVQAALVAALEARKIPKVRILPAKHNMWWRESRYIDVISDMDGTITSTIHIQEYGSSLWIGRAVEAAATWNYYKRMAASAFIETIDRCIRETITAMVDASAIRPVSDIGKKHVN